MTGRAVSEASVYALRATVLVAAWLIFLALCFPWSARAQDALAPPAQNNNAIAEEHTEGAAIATDATAALPSPSARAPASTADAVLGAVNEVVERLNVHVHGFASQGFILSAENNYLARSTSGSFEFAEAAVNVTSNPMDELRIGVQLFARDLGPIGNYDIKLDWFYVDYRFTDWFGIRAGRTKIPFGLYNELNDVDVARVPVLLPQSTYPTAGRDFLLAQTGGEIYGRVPLDVVGALEYRIYSGTIFVETPAYNPTSTSRITSFEVPYIVGGRLLWETPIEGLRLGASAQILKLNVNYLSPGDVRNYATIFAALWMASIEYTNGPLLLAAEYSRWHTETEGTSPTIARVAASERAHAMMNYRISEWFHPGAYYAVLYGNADVRTGRAAQQHDVALTLRFDINNYWLVKLEGHLMHGTAGLSAALNGGAPLATLAETWGVFLLKTTGYF